MISETYQGYPKYRPSEVEWLNQVPQHWFNVPIKYMALDKESLFLDGDWIESKDIAGDEIRYITTGNIGEGAYKEQGLGFITQDKFEQLKCTEVFEGDILISRLNAPIGRSCLVPDLKSRIVTSVDNVIFRVDKKFNEKFVVYLFSSKDYFKHTANLARGATMQRISRGLLGNIRIVSPPLSEQKAIAYFLDHETAKIDMLIEKQQQLIKLLKEKRQAVISHAVTKGLDPDVPMRDSGVEWFDSMPEHWKILELKFVAKDGYKTFTDGDWIESPYITDSGVRLLQTGNVGIGEFKEKGFRYVSNNTFKKLNCTEVKPNDVLICRLDGPVGRSCLAPDLGVKVITSVDNAILKPSGDFDPRFIVYLTNCAPWLDWVADLCRVGGGFRLRVSRTMLGDQRIPAPPIEEQKLIADKLDALSDHSLKCMERCEEGILLLRERRTALISAAVTGKIDVRNWEPAEC